MTTLSNKTAQFTYSSLLDTHTHTQSFPTTTFLTKTPTYLLGNIETRIQLPLPLEEPKRKQKMAKGTVNWDSQETWQRIVAAIIATGVKVSEPFFTSSSFLIHLPPPSHIRDIITRSLTTFFSLP